MLTWDEEVKPSVQNLGGASGVRPVEPPSFLAMPTRMLNDAALAPVAPSVPAAKPASAGGKRIKAADKRIINGQTDVNQLVPFKYKWAWEKLRCGKTPTV